MSQIDPPADTLKPLRADLCQSSALACLREKAAREHRTTRRLNDAITALLLLVALFLMIGGFVAEATIGPAMPVFEITVFIGTACLAVNVYKNAM